MEAVVAVRTRVVSPSRLLDDRLDKLIAAELDRLARRAPTLGDDHLGVVEASLKNVIDRLLPARVRDSARPEDLTALFDLSTQPV